MMFSLWYKLTALTVLLCSHCAPVFAAGVLPPERRPAQRPGRPGRPQPADGERGEGVLCGALPSPEAAQGGRDGQTGPEGHAGLGPGTQTTNMPAESDGKPELSSVWGKTERLPPPLLLQLQLNC